MLTARTDSILKYVVGQYIASTVPVSSQSITENCALGVSSATIRNEMAQLEREGYITRPHTSSGSIPTDKGYRHYVESLGEVKLPAAEQRMISHLFHQVERELEEWLNLAATLVAQMVQNTAIVTMPKPTACHFKHLELVSLQDSTVLLVLVLSGAKLRQQLITFEQAISQAELTIIATKLTTAYSNLTSAQIQKKVKGLSAAEQMVTDYLTKLMEAEDEQEFEKQYLDGLHYLFNQPEFTQRQRLLTLMELVEHRSLMKNIIPPEPTGTKVQVIIGRENKIEAIQDFSVVISRYGLPQEAVGTIGVIGPTRMPYGRTIATVEYLSRVLSELEARLYGRETPVEQE